MNAYKFLANRMKHKNTMRIALDEGAKMPTRAHTWDGGLDLTGSIKVKLFNHGQESYHVKAGDKIAQLVIFKCELPTLEVVDALEETDRGDNGFGSTGR